MTTPPAAPPAEPAIPNFSIDQIFAHVESFVRGVLTLDPEQAAIRGGLSLLVLLGAALLIWGLRVVLRALTERVAPTEDGAPPKKRLQIGRWSLRIARWAILITAIVTILRVWGFDFTDLKQGPLGAAFSIGARIAFILVIALAAIELTQLGITRVFSRIAKRARNPRRAAQVRTLAPLLSGVVTTTLVVVAAMMTLSEFGVEIGPLIAGAGIVGLAVGFGAQTLVKDFLTGIFLILEDIVSIGDIVQIGDFSGRVEEMTLRTIRLRDYDGTLHVFPYGEAQVIHNRSKNFSYYAFELQISYMSDVDLAIQTARTAGERLRAEPDFAPLILEPVDIAGIDKLSDNGVLLRGRLKTQPGQQFKVGREYQRIVKTALEEAGILFSHRHQPAPPFEDIADRAKP